MAGIVAAALVAAPAYATFVPAPFDAGVTVVDQDLVLTDPLGAYFPELTRAANDDLVLAYSTGGGDDINFSGGEVKVVRSSDDGATWSTPVVVAEQSIFPGLGAMQTSVGMLTLSDGTILLPFNEAYNPSMYNHRESALFVARSDDDGVTWTNTTTPVPSPVATQEQYQYGKMLELSDGTVLMPVWGSRELVSDWSTDPKPWEVGLLRSTDQGATWSSYSTLATDPHVVNDSSRGNGPNETSVVQLRDGRLMAIMRFDVGSSAFPDKSFITYSADGGLTWDVPRASEVRVENPSMTLSTCSAVLPTEQSKVLMVSRNLINGSRVGNAVRASFDDGASWSTPVNLKTPSGADTTGEAAYAAFAPLSHRKQLVVFHAVIGGEYVLVSNVLQDQPTSQDCRDEAEAASEFAADNPTVFVQRDGYEDWPFAWAQTSGRYDATTLVSTLVTAFADGVICTPSSAELRRADGTPLNPALSLAANGVANGDRVTVHSLDGAPASGVVTGVNHSDNSPATKHLSMWSDVCDFRIALDVTKNVVGIRVDEYPVGESITSIALRDTDGSTRLTGSDYKIWESDDNDAFTEVTGWTFGAAVDGSGRMVHTFSGLSIDSPYVKISQSYGDSNYTFVLGSVQDDVIVTID